MIGLSSTNHCLEVGIQREMISLRVCKESRVKVEFSYENKVKLNSREH